MSKNLLQDVKIKRTTVVREKFFNQEPEPREEFEDADEGATDRPKHKIWIVVAISSIFFLVAISYLFLRAVITVEPKTQSLVLDENLSASSDASGEVLPFDLIIISGEETRVVTATEEKDVSRKAEGTVMIYNNFSSATQRLDIDTRLEGSNGKIYKTKKQIVVPGMKGATPGSIEVGIYGAEGGDEYNSGPLDFTIFGFKGTPKYSKFYARSKGQISGGFKGKTLVISEAEKSSVVPELKTALEAKLFKQATDQIPSGFVLFKDAVFLDIDESMDLAPVSSDQSLPVKVTGKLYGFLFNEEKLAQKIARENVKDYDGSSIYLSGVSNLIFSLTSPFTKESVLLLGAEDLANVKNISFNLKGETKVVSKIDEDKLVADLLGKSKKDFTQILEQYSNINSANLEISPFWKRSLPDKSKDIKVIVNYPE